jgi:hypothetical protein
LSNGKTDAGFIRFSVLPKASVESKKDIPLFANLGCLVNSGKIAISVSIQASAAGLGLAGRRIAELAGGHGNSPQRHIGRK